jgi:glucuronoarabinoxylan endo-1,4-beta-xylanase
MILAAVIAVTTAVSAPEPDFVVDWSSNAQVIEGFGAAQGPFNKAGSIYRLPNDEVRDKMLDNLFSREKGLGLTILRNIVGDGGFNYAGWGNDYDGSADTIWPSKEGGFVWDQPDWAEKKADFDLYQVWIAKEALARNPDITILVTVWSPPHWMKTNNSIMGNDNQAVNNGQPTNAGRLKPENYQDFADYLAEYVLGYQREFGIPIHIVSIANESSLNSSYAHCAWSAAELNTFVRDHLGPTFAAKNVPAEIMMPENVGFSEDSRVTTALNDPITVNYVDKIGTHAYGLNLNTEVVTGTFPVTKSRGKGLWQTEFMSNGAPQDNVFENNLAGDGVRYSKIMSDMLNFAEINAYIPWWGVGNSGADGSNLIRLANDGTPQGSAAANFTGTETGEYRDFKRFYAFGHWSRFVRPGMVRISHPGYQPADGVRIAVFKDEASGRFVINAINQGHVEQTLTLGLDGFPLPAYMAAYRTSDFEDHLKIDSVAVDEGTLTITLPAASVTSFVTPADELPGLNAGPNVFSRLKVDEAERSAGLIVAGTPGGGNVITGIRNGDYVKVTNFNFADGSASGAAALRYVLSMHAKVAAQGGGALEAHVDSPDGPLVGFVEVPAGFQGWAKVSTPIDTTHAAAYGHRDLYIVATGGDGELFHLGDMSFDQGRIAPAPDAELIVNGGAEISAPLTWNSQGTGQSQTQRNTTIFRSGTASVGSVNRTAATRGVGQAMFNKLDYGYTYDLSAWMRPATLDDVMRAQISVARTGRSALLYDIGTVPAVAGEWVELSTSFTIPVPVSMISGVTIIFSTVNTTTAFNLDDVTMALSNEPAVIVPPSLVERMEAISERVIALVPDHSSQVRMLHDIAKAVEFVGKNNSEQAWKFIGDFLKDIGKLEAAGNISASDAELLRELANNLAS